jgi:hypothetical protein
MLSWLQAVVEVPAQSERPSIDLSRSLAIVHQLCQTHIDELKKISQIKVICSTLLFLLA